MSVIETVERQIQNFFGVNVYLNEDATHRALYRTRLCIEAIKPFNDNPYFDSSDPRKNVLFLWFLSNEHKDLPASKQIYYLNKVLHGCDLPPGAGLPEIFYIPHTNGVVICNGVKIPDYSVFYQGTTIGRVGNNYPAIGARVLMYPYSSIIGRSTIHSPIILSKGGDMIDIGNVSFSHTVIWEKNNVYFERSDLFGFHFNMEKK